jgi:hypothetical protein
LLLVGSSNSSHSNPRDQTHRDERLETHLEAEKSEDEDSEYIDDNFKGKFISFYSNVAEEEIAKQFPT